MASSQKEQIFISYSRRDSEKMQRLVGFLRDKGFDVWVDNEELVPGTPAWERELEKAIKRSNAVVVLLSPDSKASEWVMRELVVAQRHAKHIFPILVRGDEDSALPFRLSTYQYIDFRGQEEIGLEELYKAISDFSISSSAATDVTTQIRKDHIVREKRKAEEKTNQKAGVEKPESEKARTAKNSRRGTALFIVTVGFLCVCLGVAVTQINFIPGTPSAVTQEFFQTDSATMAIGTVAQSSPLATSTPRSTYSPAGSPGDVPPTTPVSIVPAPFTPTTPVPIIPTTFTPITPVPVISTTLAPMTVLVAGSTMTSDKDDMIQVYIPAGEFQMGYADGDNHEKPVHNVFLNAYWIDQIEVTNAMYANCVAAGECAAPDSNSSSTRESYYGNPLYSNYPVIHISWQDANSFCSWAERRLPSEAEWEKAAGWNENLHTQMLYPWGNVINSTYANYGNNVGDTTTVRNYEKGKSFYGAYDMAGNVFEWVGDWYASDYYASSPEENPLGPGIGGTKVVRGGAWLSSYDLNLLRVAFRGKKNPIDSNSSIGFRCAFSP